VDGVIEVPGSAPIYIRSTENANVIEGMTLRWIWADEAGQMKLEAWINFQGRLSILKGNFLATTTPYTLNWLFLDFYEQWKKGNSDYLVVQYRSCDNPYFPKEEYDRVKLTMDPRTFRRRYDGLFEKMEGLVYEDLIPSVHYIEPANIIFKEVIGGIDWGFSNPAAVAIIGITADNAFYVIDEYYMSGKTTGEIIEKLKYFQTKYKIRFWYPDNAEPDRLEEMRRSGVYPRDIDKSSGSITSGINALRDFIRQNRLFVFNTCRNTMEEFGLYHYPTSSTKTEKEDPIKEDDHLMDAIRYAIYTYSPQTVVRPIIKRYYKPVNSVTGY